MSISYKYKDPETGIEFDLTDFAEWGGLPVLASYFESDANEYKADSYEEKTCLSLDWLDSKCEELREFRYCTRMGNCKNVRPRWSKLEDVIDDAPEWAKWLYFSDVDGRCYWVSCEPWKCSVRNDNQWQKIEGHIFEPIEPINLAEFREGLK